MTVLLDTNVVVELLRPSPNPVVEAWVASRPLAELYLSAIGEAELRHCVALLPAGAYRDDVASALDAILREDLKNQVLPFDSGAAREYADIAISRRAAGRHFTPTESQIAAIARSRGMSIATRNTADFEDMAVDVTNPWQVP